MLESIRIVNENLSNSADSEKIIVDLAIYDDLFEQDRSHDELETIILGM